MKLYSAADLHSNNHFLAIIDEQDKRVLEKRLPNDLATTLKTLEPYRAGIVGIAVESTFNWYWLVDGLIEAGYTVKLVNTSKVRQYEGLKYTDDRHDAFWLAYQMRLGICPRATSTRKSSVPCAICCANGAVWYDSARQTCSPPKARCGGTLRSDCRPK